jgi:DNA repair exonuclease SbcCD ATPase subunit
MTDYPKAPFGEPAELVMRECERCAELQQRLAAAETEVARLGRCNDQLSRTHAEIINSQNANLAAAEARCDEAKRTIEHKYLTNELVPVELLRATEQRLAAAESRIAELTEQLAFRNKAWRERLAAAEALLREACEVWKETHMYSHETSLKLIPVSTTWYDRAKEVCGG